jgi:hypothetical protein
MDGLVVGDAVAEQVEFLAGKYEAPETERELGNNPAGSLRAPVG